MNIVLVDVLPVFERCLKELGHTLKVFHFGGGVFHLPSILAQAGFSPDFVLQQEVLGKRNYLGGLDRIDCPTAFWALDSHLNMFWHMWYARLFDLVLTPHVSLFNALPEQCRIEQSGGQAQSQIRRFAWPGEARAFVPHAERANTLGLCARMTGHRPMRAWLTELLRPRGLVLKEGLPHDQMMAFYDATRTVPNECLANEVNFRLMEGASSGALVLSPNVGEDQDALLEPGKEYLIYRDGLELLDCVSWASLRPAAAEKMGHAALRRIQAEHLPLRRMEQLLRELPSLSQKRLTGTAAMQAFWLTLARQIRNGTLGLDVGHHADEGLNLARSAMDGTANDERDERFLAGQVMLQAFHLFAEDAAYREKALWLQGDIFSLLGRRMRGEDTCGAGDMLLGKDMLASASAFALREGQIEMAKMLWRGSATEQFIPDRAALGAAELCALWAGALEKEGKAFNAGFHFDPERGMLPEDGLSWLIYARHLEPGSKAVLAPHFDALLENRPELLPLHVGYLAEHCLLDSENWRVQMGFGLNCIKACRVSEGLYELHEARVKAAAQGRERLFLGRLNAWRPGLLP